MTLLRNATVVSGQQFDVAISSGVIIAIDQAGRGRPVPTEPSYDLDGYLLLAAPADPHAHLDKAFSADQVANPAGDLSGAIEAWQRHYPNMSVEEIASRARRASLSGLVRGYTAMRSHVDVSEGVGLKAVEALLSVRAELAPMIDVQVCGLVATPTTGEAGASNRAVLREALEMGIDAVGGAPYRDPDPVGCLRFCLNEAAAFARPVDLHIDETLDRSVLVLRDYARIVRETGFSYGATAGHCVSLGMQEPDVQRDVAEEVAAAGISVIANPFTNLYLQARDRPVGAPRGLTALRPLLDAGVNLGAGTDNVEDPFNIMGRTDPLEVAALLVMAGHLSPDEAFWAVSGAARQSMGLPPNGVTVGSPADLLAVRAGSLREALAAASVDRLVFRKGELVARTEVSEWIHPSLPTSAIVLGRSR
jgi:cytosine deaminase